MKVQFRKLFAIIITFVSLNALSTEKVMYKWKDNQGEIHYTERAPKGIEYTKIITYVDSRTSTATKLPVKTEDPAKAQKDSYGTWRNENCTIANQNLDVLQNASRIGVDDGQGGKRLMTDEEKKAKIASMTAQRDKYCKKGDDKKN